MCGILFGCYIEHTNGTDNVSLDNSPLWNRLRELNRQRGPDSQQTYSIRIPISSDTNLVLKFHSTVLHLRGDSVIAQPILDEIHGAKTEGIDDLEKGNIGCWNGEVFGDMVLPDQNDTEIVMSKLFGILNDKADDNTEKRKETAEQNKLKAILNFFEQLEGPYAFLLWEHRTQKLYFGRDYFGRRSLLWHFPRNPKSSFPIPSSPSYRVRSFRQPEPFIISSIGTFVHSYPLISSNKDCSKTENIYLNEHGGEDSDTAECKGSKDEIDEDGKNSFWEEIQANGIYCLDFANIVAEMKAGTRTFEDSLRNNLQKYPWVQEQNSVAGGDKHAQTTHSLTLPFPPVNLNITHIPPLDSSVPLNVLPDVLPHELSAAVDGFLDVLKENVRSRVINVTRHNTGSSPSSSSPAKIAILFSGGIDCTVLALLTHMCIPEHESIDLLNVAFENPRIMEARKKERENGKGKGKKRGKGRLKQKGSINNGDHDDGAANVSAQIPEVGVTEEKVENDIVNNDEEGREEIYDVPDRKTGRQGLQELRLLAPNRRWNFVEINIPYSAAMDKKLGILELMSPLDTIMDLSIAMAFWFSARGKGYISRDGKTEPYETPAKVLISGLGADEQLGGYGRHRVQYNKESWEGLAKEIKMDVERIWTRNLGRDDRIISSHSREPRFPYLSAPVVNYLSSLPVYLKCDPRFDKGIGDKILIRLLAKKLGLEKTSVEAKRAVQFGSRTAKMGETSTKEKGMMKVDLA